MTTVREWVGGLITLSTWITSEEGADYQPQTLLWMDTDSGQLTGSITDHPDNMPGIAVTHLRTTIRQPEIGRPVKPTRIRVANKALAEELRAAYPDIDIVVAPTPELDDTVGMTMRRTLSHQSDIKDEDEDNEEDEGAATWWHHSVPEQTLASLFVAAAELQETNPYTKVPSDGCQIHVTLPELDTNTFLLKVRCQAGQGISMLVFNDLPSYQSYLDVVTAHSRGDAGAVMPAHSVLLYQSVGSVLPDVRRIARENQWRVADGDNYPTVAMFGPGRTAKYLCKDDIVFFEALIRILLAVFANLNDWRAAWQGSKEIGMKLAVETSDGTHTAFVGSEPWTAAPLFDGSDNELLAAFELFDWNDAPESLDTQQLQRLESSLLERVANSPEAAAHDDPSYGLRLMIDYAWDYFYGPVTQLRARDIRDLLFEMLPRKLVAEPDDALDIVTTMRMALQWMHERRPLQHGDACIAVLDNATVARLEEALADKSKYGPGKRLSMAAAAAGYDSSSQKDMEQYLRETQGLGLSPYGPGVFADHSIDDDLPPRDPAQERKQKKKRKASRKAAKKARKKNR